jgi:hypothetical protein
MILAIPMLAQEGRQSLSLTHDWSHRHVIYTNSGTSAQNAFAAARDPRALAAFWRRLAIQQNAATKHSDPGKNKPFGVDWAFSMGTPNTATPIAASQFPATFVANFTSPSCTADFLVLPVNIAGSVGTANLIGLNQLYSNSAGTGFCATTGPAVLFAYNTGAAGGANATSVATSLDGKKIVWVENSTPAKLHVLAWKSEGTVGAPIDLSTRGVAGAPAAGSGTVATVTLSGNVTNSAPFVDYDDDLAYVGDNSGNLYRIKNVFCTTAACIASPAGPSIDTAWATNPVNLAATVLTPPVADFVTGNIYIGGANGNLYVRNSANGGSVTGSPVAVGNANQGGVTDAPILDRTGANGNELVYAFAGDDTGVTGALNAAVAVQVQVSLSTHNVGTVTRQNIGAANRQPIHMGAPNDAYYTAVGTARLYVCGVSAGGGSRHIFRIPFGANLVIGAPVDLGTLAAGSNQSCSPLTEFNNGTNDRLFLTLGTTRALNDYLITSDLASSTCPNGATCLRQSTNTGAATDLTSGIVIDNGATGTAQGANIYFGVASNGNITNGSCWTGAGAGAAALALSGTSSLSANTANVTTNKAHGLAIGEMVAIAGATGGTNPANMNGNCVVVTAPSTTNFTCTYIPSKGALTASGVTGGNVQKGTCAFKLTQNALN